MDFLDTVFGRHHEKKIKDNEKILKFAEIIVPFGAFNKDKVLKKFYKEGIQCFLLGLPNASMMIMVSCLERALKKKYAETEGKSKRKNLKELLDWLKETEEDFEITDVGIPHGFRMLRNYVTHDQKLISESDAAEGIKYISMIINRLYNYEDISMDHTCQNCEEVTEFSIQKEELVLGEEIYLYCEYCDEDPELVGSSKRYKVRELF